MPRRRRSRRKLNPSIALRKKNQESAGHSSRSKSEPPLPPTVPDSPKAKPPKSEPPSEEVTGEAASTSSGEVGNEAEYKLFPEVFEKPPLGLLPTFADVFGQPSYENGYQPKDVPPAAAPTSSSSSTSTFASTSQGCGCPGIQSTADGHFTQIPATMLNDSFGMTGLLAAIRSTVTEPGSTQLIFGEDLTTYGLDLAAQGDIYVHFNGPFTMEPPERSSMDCALELGMRAMRDAMDRYPPLPPFWDPFVPETRNLGLLGVDGKKLASDQGQEPKMATKPESKSEPKTEPVKESKEDPPLTPPERSRDRERNPKSGIQNKKKKSKHR